MPNLYTLTGDFDDLLGGEAVVQTIRATITTNVEEQGGTLVDTTNKTFRFGGMQFGTYADGTWSISGLVGSNSTDLNVPVDTLEYQVTVRYAAVGGGHTTRALGWFKLNGNANLADVARQMTPTEAQTAADYVAQQAAIAGLTGEDSAVAFLVNDDLTPSQTRAALDNLYGGGGAAGLDDTAIAALVADDDAAPSATRGAIDSAVAEEMGQAGSPLRVAADGLYTTQAEVDTSVAAGVADRIKVTEAPVSPYRYGFVGDGVADDTAALQAAIDACPVGGTVRLPHTGNARIAAPLTINKAMTLEGANRENQRLLAVGCDGIRIAAGIDSVRLIGFELAAGTRYSTAANTYVGVTVDGTAANYASEHLYRDVFCDGFHTAFRTRYLWSSRFEGVRSAFGLIGIDAYGKSVNNFVTGSRLAVEKVAGSRGIRLYGRESYTDATVVASEGWVIEQSLTFGAEMGVDCVGVNHVQVNGCILDFCQLNGLRVIHNGTAFGNNVSMIGSYVGMDSTGGTAAVNLGNTVSHTQRRYARIIGNEFTVYSGMACAYGVYVSGSEARAVVSDNTFTFFTTNDVRMLTSDNIVRGNACLSTAPAQNISGSAGTNQANLIVDNVGTVFRPGSGPETQPYHRDSLGRKVAHGTAAPTAGTWVVGDQVIQAVPAVGSSKGWRCTVGGTPGTWVSEGNL